MNRRAATVRGGNSVRAIRIREYAEANTTKATTVSARLRKFNSAHHSEERSKMISKSNSGLWEGSGFFRQESDDLARSEFLGYYLLFFFVERLVL